MRINRWRRLGALSVVLTAVAVVAAGSPAAANHGQAVGSGGGTVRGTLHDGKPAGIGCASFASQTYRSELVAPGDPTTEQLPYTGTYAAISNPTNVKVADYTSYTVSPWEDGGRIYENPSGSWGASGCMGVPGAPYPVNGALFDVNRNVICSYNGTWRRVGTTVTIDWSGECPQLNGVLTHERRVAECEPQPAVGFPPIPTHTTCEETYEAPVS